METIIVYWGMHRVQGLGFRVQVWESRLHGLKD